MRNEVGHIRIVPGSGARNERGYALVALLAVMTVMALAALALAPSVKQQTQREREREAIFRGEQVAMAIAEYVRINGGRRNLGGVASLPTQMDQLLEGVTVGTRKIQILRPEAAIDPLSSTGEWKLVGPTDPVFTQFAQAVAVFAGGTLPPTHVASMRQFGNIQFSSVLNTGLTDTAPGGEDDSANSEGPFIGVVSRSRSSSVLTYYGIDRHDQWVFTQIWR